MSKKSKIPGDELVLIAKAIRRAEKLERTLTKLVTRQEPASAAEAFLKSVQKGLERLRKDESAKAKKVARDKEEPGSKATGPLSAAVVSRPKKPRKSQKTAPAKPQAKVA